MAKKNKVIATKAPLLTNREWGTIFANIITRGYTLQREARRLHLSKEELMRQGDKKYPVSREWKEVKRISAKREKKQRLR